MKIGLDFGLSNLDAVLLNENVVLKRWALTGPGPASTEVLEKVLENVDLSQISLIATTGGRHLELPSKFRGLPIISVDETHAIGRGGLAVSGKNEVLVVSAGSGTAIIAAREGYRHVTGTAVGGGTLLGLSRQLLKTTDAREIERLSLIGNSQAVDWTLADALRHGIGSLPVSATAVNLGRLAEIDPEPADLAAGLINLIGQVIAVIAINAAKACSFTDIVFTGHLTDFSLIKCVIEDVFDLYEMKEPIFPEFAGFSTALGAALEAK